jgi:hypothetical protein
MPRAKIIACPHCGKPIRHPSRRALDILVEDYPWPKYYKNKICLQSAVGSFKTFRDLTRMTDDELLRLPAFGSTTVRAIKIELAKHGLGLGMLSPKKI